MGCPFSTPTDKTTVLAAVSRRASKFMPNNANRTGSAAGSPGSTEKFAMHRNSPNAVDAATEAVRSSYLAGTLTVDPRCPLNDRQLFGLCKSWKAINRNMTLTAMNMFVRLFETNYDIKEMFDKLKNVETSAELRTSKVLEGHAMKVICTIDDAIVNLDDMDYVIRMLQTVAQAHSTRFPQFNPNFFSRIEEPFILAVREELGDRFTISVETTYRMTIRFILTTLTDEFVRSRPQSLGGATGSIPQHSTGGATVTVTDVSDDDVGRCLRR